MPRVLIARIDLGYLQIIDMLTVILVFDPLVDCWTSFNDGEVAFVIILIFGSLRNWFEMVLRV